MHEILTNPLVIAAVIGIISAIFGKKNKDEKRPPGTRPENRAKKQEHKQPHKEHKPEAEEMPAVSEENPFEKKRREAEKRLAETEQMFNGLEHQLTSARARNATLKKPALKIKKETAVQGIIFSEILGSPRAKKPHRTMQSIRKK
ncbi:hypothetical protein QRX25_12290 [Bacillus sp. L381]|uniref:hypothetical protein n=1 Tax=Bacillus TaxID=1386 RepID=UPI001BA45FDC|nr:MULTISPECIES: hypothetical protein [Bacillus]MCR9038899.1 hypothetical protein [Bacillus velezensis]QUN08314.1 hypothetical protein KEF49_12130 [Bacillus amyloliquefaciens]QYM81384.1 hypothetical protein KTJ85_11980 [Bacillus sp. 7D3]QZY10532.1 hypothetical protein K7B13_12220 [Bacillus amyloliquefaciens]WIX20430.1 hypothetical protein QRX25_12290 [Bacillus sp. L381]